MTGEAMADPNPLRKDEVWLQRLTGAGVVNVDGVPLVDGTIIELVQDLRRTILSLQQQVEELGEYAHAAQDDTTRKSIQIRKLKAEGDRRLKNDPLYPLVLEVLRYWRDKCHPNAREIEGGERPGKVIARLRGKPKPYTVEDLKECVDGYAAFPYVVSGRGRLPTGSPAQRRIDAELIFRDPSHVDQGRAYAQEAKLRAEPAPAPPQETSVLGPIGATAVKYASWGLYVFPIKPRDKIPATRHGLLDAVQDVDRITQFWTTHPNHNLGLRCGLESELVVLDVDDRKGGLESLHELEKKWGAIPKTTTVVTPGGGTHFYFRHPGAGEIANTTSFPGPGLDIRGDGGYVLAPPSVGPNGGCYEFDDRSPRAAMPSWLLKLLTDHQSRPKQISKDYAAMVRMGVQEGERNDQLTSLTGHLWNFRMRSDEIFELVMSVNRAKCKPPLPDGDVEKIIDSIARREARKALRANLA